MNKFLLTLFTFLTFSTLIFSQDHSTCALAEPLVLDTNCSGTSGGANSGDPTGFDGTDGNLCSSSYSEGDDYIFSYVGTGNALALDLTGTGTWSGILLTEGCPTTGTCIASATSSTSSKSLISPALTAGVTYYIHISTYPSPQSIGQFCLNASETAPPANHSTCVLAAPLVLDDNCVDVSGGANSGDPSGFDGTDGNVCSSNYSGGDDYIFVYTGTGAALELELFGTNSWTGIMVTEGCPATGTCVGFSGSSSTDETLTTDVLDSGVDYYFHVSTFPSPQSIGQFCLNASEVSSIPNCAMNLSPADGATDVAVECGGASSISWDAPSSGTPPDNYNIYFGTTSSPPLVGSTTSTNYSITGLSANTTYYYQIIPEANSETAVGCPVVSFTTGSSTNDSGSGGTNNVYYFANNNNTQGSQSGAFIWDDPVAMGHTEVTSTTSGSFDDGYITITLPFSFQFYGVEYTDVHIGTNGYLSFDQGYTSTGSTVDLGSTSSPNSMIALAMMDLDDGTEGKIYHGPIDDITYAITWYHYIDYLDQNEYITMQVLLQDLPGTDNDVFEIRFNQDESTAIPDFLADAVIGCEDISANATTEFARYREDGVGGPMFCSSLTIGFAPTEAGVLLPLDLIEWNGASMKEGNKLYWTTANELNTASFSIEKLYNSSDWRSIGTVEAAGNSNEVLNYSFMDDSPSSKELYRLKSMDLDGSYSYSEVITLSRAIDTDNVNVYPNPFSDEVNVQVELVKDQDLTINIYDITGKVISTVNQIGFEGSNKFILNLADHQTGIYIISIQLENKIIQKRIIKK